jgi:hypothetical protein
MAVHEHSALGHPTDWSGGGFILPAGKFVRVDKTYKDTEGRNHSSIAEQNVASYVRRLVLRAEALDQRGDIR